jgi:hypothetical protein
LIRTLKNLKNTNKLANALLSTLISEEHSNLILKYEYSCAERTVNWFLKTVYDGVP